MAERSELPKRIPGMSRENASALFDLKARWGDRYLVAIGRDGSGVQHWQAARIGSSATFDITADTPEQLNNKLGENYRQWMRDSQRHNQ
jgi:hypothetical protein